MSVVLVTGTSSGFGRLIVEALAERGHTVFAGMREVAGRNAVAATELSAAGARVVELDVTSQASADRAIATVIETAGRLDVVINNAGGIFPGPVEAFTAEQAQTQFDTNVFGALRVNRAALPHLRGQGSGVVIQMGSLAGRVTIPYSGLYAASKAALHSLTEAWHHELAPFGVESIVVEAASYPTNIGANAVLPTDAGRMAAYGDGFGRYVGALTARQTGSPADPADPAEVSDAVVRLVETPDGKRPRSTIVAPVAQLDAVASLAGATDRAARAVATDMGAAAFLAP